MIGLRAPSLVDRSDHTHMAALRAGYSWRTLEWALKSAAEPWANRVLDQVEQQMEDVKDIAAGALATGCMSDAQLRILAGRRAWLTGQRIDAIASSMASSAFLAWLNGQLVPLQARAFRFQGERPEADQLRGFLARARCHLWWRRQLRRAVVLLRERAANEAGEVCASRKQPYVTHDTLARHQAMKAAAAAMMAATELENEDGQAMTLADLAAASVSNKAIRRGELMTRITGCEKWADTFGFKGVFLTLTAPSRFHRVHRYGGLNDRWQPGCDPKEAQGWLSAAWARARAKMARLGIGVFGFRVAEPHHDGCPHWHGLLWAEAGELWRVVRVIKRAWLKLDGGEPGARQHRVKAMAMRKGGAAGYIAKYIAKNIDDHGAVRAQGHLDEDFFGPGRSQRAGGQGVAEASGSGVSGGQQPDLFGGTAGRVEAWASSWGIRQFQAIGQPPVTVWRELRRIENEGGATARMARAIEAANRDDERKADWAGYMLQQGGVMVGRNYLLKLAMWPKMRHGRYESGEVQCPVGVIDTTEPFQIQPSARREWRPRGEWGQGERNAVRGPYAPRVSPPWTRVNNCTRFGDPGPLEVWTERIKREPWGGSQHESDPEPCPIPPLSKPPQSSTEQSVRLQRTLLLCKSIRERTTSR